MRGEQVQVLSGHLDHEERGVQQEDGRKAAAAARGAEFDYPSKHSACVSICFIFVCVIRYSSKKH